MQQVWKDMVEEQLLSEILRRETVARLAKEQNKPDPLANEKPAEEKLLMRYERIQRNIQETSSYRPQHGECCKYRQGAWLPEGSRGRAD